MVSVKNLPKTTQLTSFMTNIDKLSSENSSRYKTVKTILEDTNVYNVFYDWLYRC